MRSKYILTSFLTVLTAFAAGANADEEDSGMKVIPVEMFACKYNYGQGPGGQRWSRAGFPWVIRSSGIQTSYDGSH